MPSPPLEFLSDNIEFSFDPEKSLMLKQTRGISFEEIIVLMEAQLPLLVMRHPNVVRYPNQHFCEINVNGYIYLVPLVIDGRKVFLKTIFPSRKATKKRSKGAIQ